MNYAWDEAKAAANLTKHGVGFADAERFDWKRALVRIDDRKDYGELRQIAYSFIGERLHCLVYTRRGDFIRVISLRRAKNKERRSYEQEAQRKHS